MDWYTKRYVKELIHTPCSVLYLARPSRPAFTIYPVGSSRPQRGVYGGKGTHSLGRAPFWLIATPHARLTFELSSVQGKAQIVKPWLCQ